MDPENLLHKVSKHTPSILGSKNFVKFAILLPLIEKNNETHVLFEVRSHKMRRQPGEICFPGGRIDQQDSDAKAAALRETREELGIPERDLLHVHPLDYLVSPFGMIVYPYAGYINQPYSAVDPNPDEVGDVFTVPLSYLMETEPEIHHVGFEAKPKENFPFELIEGGKDYNWQTRQFEEYFYKYEDKVIWGLTARILSHFIDMVSSEN